MKKYRSIDLDYGVNTALIDAYKAMQREMELQEEEDEDMEDIVPANGDWMKMQQLQRNLRQKPKAASASR